MVLHRIIIHEDILFCLPPTMLLERDHHSSGCSVLFLAGSFCQIVWLRSRTQVQMGPLDVHNNLLFRIEINIRAQGEQDLEHEETRTDINGKCNSLGKHTYI
ncbi:hypothetical protein ILYODFUR_018826 [Ilyodon furcidens]|uniref:Uncharacterized protein n=1 Tax=Ilyodon furcidens TaxID=33524 RepID=A0ABV0T986_9TELE